MEEILEVLKPHMTLVGRHLVVTIALIGVLIESLVRFLVRIPFTILSALILLVDAFVVNYFMKSKQEENALRIQEEERRNLIKEIWKK